MAGCSNKPPGCADSAVKQAVIDTALEQALKGDGDVPAYHSYYKKAKVELAEVTTSGYDEGARRHACQATLAISDSHDTTSIPLAYTVQGLEGPRGEYRVAYFDPPYPLRLTLMGTAQRYLSFYAAEEQAKAAALAARAETVAPAIIAEPEPKPTIIQQTAAEPAVANAAASAPTAAPPASSEESRVSPSLALQAVALPSTTAPSFKCNAKLSPTEQLICDTPALARADAAMALAYAKAVTAATDPAALKQRQRDWRETRDACVDAGCVQASYATRTEELSR